MPAYTEHGLFVWRGDGRYAWDERLDGKTYKRATAAEKEAARRNARGEHGGMIVVRPRMLIHERRTRTNPLTLSASYSRGKKTEHNPPLAIFANPRVRPERLSERCYSIEYRHVGDGKNYRHDFGSGVHVHLLGDGSVLLKHKDGKPLWGDFDV